MATMSDPTVVALQRTIATLRAENAALRCARDSAVRLLVSGRRAPDHTAVPAAAESAAASPRRGGIGG